jgi:hypothetical protein
MTLEHYLNQITHSERQLLMDKLNINSTDLPIVTGAAHRLYWDQLWPAKLRVVGDHGKKLLENTTYTGLSLIDSVNTLNPSMVLDIGCGQNFYKHKIKNLVGLDMFGQDCDLQVDYFNSSFDTKADVVLVLGMLEYGSADQVHRKLCRIKQNCHQATQIFFRFNISPEYGYEIMPGRDICFFMHKLICLPEQWNQAIVQAGFDVLFSDWDTPQQRWHIRAVAKLIDNPEE